VEQAKHVEEFPGAGSLRGSGHFLQCTYHREEFLPGQSVGTAESGILAGLDKLTHTSYVVIVPVCGNYQTDGLGWLYSELAQIVECGWLTIRSQARIDYYPPLASDMDEYAFSVSWPEETYLNLVEIRG